MSRILTSEQISNLRKWAKALNSGKYQQGENALRVISDDSESDSLRTRYCCLGVLCDISAVGEWSGRRYMTPTMDGFDNDGYGYPTSDVRELVGLASTSKRIPMSNSLDEVLNAIESNGWGWIEVWDNRSMARLNDRLQLSFEDISRVILAVADKAESQNG